MVEIQNHVSCTKAIELLHGPMQRMLCFQSLILFCWIGVVIVHQRVDAILKCLYVGLMTSILQAGDESSSSDDENDDEGARRTYQVEEDDRKFEKGSVDGSLRNHEVGARKKLHVVRREYGRGLYHSWRGYKVQVRKFLGAEFEGLRIEQKLSSGCKIALENYRLEVA